MIAADPPANERERLEALRDYEILDTDPEQAFDDLTRIAARICGTPIALVSLVDAHRQWFKSRLGLETPETPREVAFCPHAIRQPDRPLVVRDAHLDQRFADNPLVTGEPRVRFYAGSPLLTPGGLALGTLCVIDHEPRDLDAEQLDTLRALGRQVETQLELRKKCIELRELASTFEDANGKLARRNAEIRSFYHTLAHELKTPLTAAREFVSLVLEGISGPVTADQRDYLATAKECCDKIRLNIEDLLDVTRLETGKLTLDLQPAPIDGIVALAIAETRSAARDAALSLHSDVPSGLPPVLVDDARIGQVLTNLIGNAIKFTPAGGRVTVSARCSGSEPFAFVEVADTGVGIEAEQLEHVFDRLYQVRREDSSIKGGLGLGLSLCREIVRLHGGTITADSTPGRGSSFVFSIPVSTGAGTRGR